MLKVELHAHTSDDPIDRIPHSAFALIDRASALGYDALAITLHDTQVDLAPYAEYAAARMVTLIPGIEREIHRCHVLLLNYSKASEQVHSFADLAQLRSRERGLVVAPHPFYPIRSVGRQLSRHPELFDAVEYNAMYTRSLNFNRTAERWACQHGKPLVGNGDIHRLEQLGTTYTLVEADRDPAAICAAIAAGRAQVVTTALSWPVAVRIFSGMMTSALVPHWLSSHHTSRAPV